jgi:Histidine kinase-, DNA gyrase B-, and HSP90-like ATPase
MSPSYDIANPGAAELFESLRAFGYDLPTALADIVDNSISAHARNVWIDLHWAGAASRITVRDDGDGMTEHQLVQAMRPGSASPIAVRSPNDLGRFGLGMKTASISQCRRLTVLTKTRSTGPSVRCWDLDYISSTGTGEWRLLKGDELLDPEDRALLSGQPKGTVVFWDRLDQLVGDAAVDDEKAQRHFRERADAVKAHLAMVFHRFMSGRDFLTIHINGRAIEPWDPFLEDEPATDSMSSETLMISGEKVQVKPFVLPHHSKISAEKHALASGPKGWNAHQGFYVYRNRRLLVAGDWLGLGIQKEEHYKLARIRIDLENSSDLMWQIDVKKSRARPPAPLISDLQRIARAARNQAAGIYRHRGRVLQRQHGDQQVFVWKHLIKHGKTFYKISREHPLVKKVLSDATDPAALRALLNLIEQTVPAPLIVIKSAESPDALGQPFEDSTSELKQAMEAVFSAMIEAGRDRAEAARTLVLMEPFNHHPDLVAAFLENQQHV